MELSRGALLHLVSKGNSRVSVCLHCFLYIHLSPSRVERPYIRLFGFLAFWLPGFSAFWLLASWPVGFLASWLLASWLPGFLAVWFLGFLASRLPAWPLGLLVY